MFENGVLLGDITVWRAVMEVPTSDARSTGAPVMGGAAARWQHDLDASLDRALGTGEWGRLLPTLDPALAHDPERLVIARGCTGSRRGVLTSLIWSSVRSGRGRCRMSAPLQRSGGASPALPRSGRAGRHLAGPRRCWRPSRRHPDADRSTNTCPATATTDTAPASASEDNQEKEQACPLSRASPVPSSPFRPRPKCLVSAFTPCGAALPPENSRPTEVGAA